MIGYIGIAVTVVFTACGQLLIKGQIDRVMSARGPEEALLQTLWQLLINPLVIAGLALAGCAAVGWILAMMKLPFNVAYPIIVGLLAMLPIIGSFVLGESLSLSKILAMIMIFGGVLMLANLKPPTANANTYEASSHDSF